MNEPNSQKPKTPAEQEPKIPKCVRCGKDGFVQKDDGEWLCEDCYPILGSCCAEFAGDDMNPKD